MIDSNQYIRNVKRYFNFLTTELGFKLSKERINGNAFYDVCYSAEKLAVSISYENIADYFKVNIYILNNGDLPDYDEKAKHLNLNSLNATVFPRIDSGEIIANNKLFMLSKAEGELEKMMLKSARELRLCLKYFDEVIIMGLNN